MALSEIRRRETVMIAMVASFTVLFYSEMLDAIIGWFRNYPMNELGWSLSKMISLIILVSLTIRYTDWMCAVPTNKLKAKSKKK